MAQERRNLRRRLDRRPQHPGGRHLEAKPGAGPIWARYYSIDTEKPIFGDRDKTIHDEVNELTLERRNGYAWYGTGPQQALEAYAEWSKTHAPSANTRASKPAASKPE